MDIIKLTWEVIFLPEEAFFLVFGAVKDTVVVESSTNEEIKAARGPSRG
jgi:hypothetical protein